MFADEGIEQRGLADVGAAGEGDCAAAGHVAKLHGKRETGNGKRDSIRSARFPLPVSRIPKHRSPSGCTERASRREAGGGLLSHDLAVAVPSALTGLTTVFGMGTGVALSR